MKHVTTFDSAYIANGTKQTKHEYYDSNAVPHANETNPSLKAWLQELRLEKLKENTR